MANELLRNTKYYTIGVLLLAAVSTFSFLTGCTHGEGERETYLNHGDSAQYVGIATCRSCHTEQYDGFIHTGMGQSFGPATRTRSKADFKHAEIVDSSTGLHYRLFWRHDSLVMLEYLLASDHNGKTDTVHKLFRNIDYIVGSGQHTHSHLFRVGDRIYQAPMTYYAQENRWDLPPGFEGGGNSRFQRVIDAECMSCHNAMPQLVEGSVNRFERIGEGIDCERCHGPGSLHAQWRAQGMGPAKGEPDPTIIQPARLPLDRQMDLCQRCHLQGLNVLQEGKAFTDFRPGMRLKDVFEVYLPEYSGGEGKLDMANHAARFQQSACVLHKSNDQAFNCISCHNPHLSVRYTRREQFNNVCKDCHTAADAWEQKHAPGNLDCVECHMPRVRSEDILHVAIHDHRIQLPGGHGDPAQRKLLGLYAVNNPAPSKARLLQAYLEYWEKFDKNPFFLDKAEALLGEVEDRSLHIKYHFLRENYEQVLRSAEGLDEPDAWTSYMLGESAGRTGRDRLALLYWSRSVQLDPDRVEVGLKLINCYLRLEKWAEAEELGQRLREQFPSNGLVWNALGELALRQGQPAQALDPLSMALHLEPLALEVWESHLNLAIALGDAKRRMYWAGRILERHPDHPDRQRLAVLKR